MLCVATSPLYTKRFCQSALPSFYVDFLCLQMDVAKQERCEFLPFLAPRKVSSVISCTETVSWISIICMAFWKLKVWKFMLFANGPPCSFRSLWNILVCVGAFQHSFYRSVLAYLPCVACIRLLWRVDGSILFTFVELSRYDCANVLRVCLWVWLWLLYTVSFHCMFLLISLPQACTAHLEVCCHAIEFLFLQLSC